VPSPVCEALRIILIPSFALSFFWVLSCGGANTRHAAGKGEAEKVKSAEITGELSVRGTTTEPIILLESEDGTIYTVQPSSVARELARLEGMRVVVEGEVRGPLGKGPLLFDARTYRILPLESGEEPIVGRVKMKNGQCILEEDNGTEWRITGDMISILTDFAGAKVWVIGKRWEADASKRQIRVTGYSIIMKE
jgi:hypothetical protein